jgi:Tfp pilus assembly protein PilF
VIALPLVLLAAAAAQGPAVVRQTTTGWCSPIITNVTGNVTVNCIGVDPRALKRLNAELNRASKELSAKIDEANDWTERYHELETRLNDAGPNEELARQAENYLHEGELEKARDILDRILTEDDKEVSRIAAHNYNRGLIAQLEFKPVEALPYFDKAYRFRPENLEYGSNYGAVLLAQHQYAKAEPVLTDVLERLPALAAKDPTKYGLELSRTLYGKGFLEEDTNRFTEAERDYKEALTITRELAASDPPEFNVRVSRVLTSLGNLYRRTLRYDQSERVFKEAIAIDRALPDSPQNRNTLARSLYSYSVLLSNMERNNEAFAAMNECVGIRRELATANPAAFEPDFALSLQNLADDYREAKKFEDAEKTARDAVNIQTRLSAANPDAYRPTLANALGILGNALGDAGKHEQALDAYRRSADIYRELSKTPPAAFEADLAVTLSTLGSEYDAAGRRQEAEACLRESLDIYVRLSQSSLEAYGERVVDVATILAGRYMQARDFERAEPFFRQSSEMTRRLAPVNPSYFRPLLADQLQFLAFIYLQNSAGDKIGPALDEAIQIHKELAASDPVRYGDSLASDYFLASQSLESKDVARACKLVGQAVDAAQKPEIKQRFQMQFQDCSQNTAPRR